MSFHNPGTRLAGAGFPAGCKTSVPIFRASLALPPTPSHLRSLCAVISGDFRHCKMSFWSRLNVSGWWTFCRTAFEQIQAVRINEFSESESLCLLRVEDLKDYVCSEDSRHDKFYEYLTFFPVMSVSVNIRSRSNS